MVFDRGGRRLVSDALLRVEGSIVGLRSSCNQRDVDNFARTREDSMHIGKCECDLYSFFFFVAQPCGNALPSHAQSCLSLQ